jgi:hypothetical protein
LIKRDGTVSTLVQAGAIVYQWDGADSFTNVGAVNSNARLRGPREHNFTLDEWVIITDIEKIENVKKWDGTSFTDLAHDLGSDLKAKYCRVVKERAFFANVTTTTDTPHIILASKTDDSEILSDSETPTASLGEDAPFFIPISDLRPINGLEEAFGQLLISTQRGKLFRLQGETQDSFDYFVEEFHVGSATVGDEAIKNIGNDVVMGLPGRIESAQGTLDFGDVETNDLSREISPLIDNVTSWTIEFDRRLQKIFCFPNNESAIYVLHKKVLDENSQKNLEDRLSPWSKWTTSHSLNFSPTSVMQLIDPLSDQDVVYMGDALGRIFRIDGSGGQDGGTDDIILKRTSALIAPLEGNAFDIQGWISYRKRFESTINIKILGGGVALYEQPISIKLPADENLAVYGGGSHYGGSSYYGTSFRGRISEQNWRAAGHSSHFQVEISHTGSGDIDIEEVGLRFETT